MTWPGVAHELGWVTSPLGLPFLTGTTGMGSWAAAHRGSEASRVQEGVALKTGQNPQSHSVAELKGLPQAFHRGLGKPRPQGKGWAQGQACALGIWGTWAWREGPWMLVLLSPRGPSGRTETCCSQAPGHQKSTGSPCHRPHRPLLPASGCSASSIID